MPADTSSLANRKRPRTLNQVQGHQHTVDILSLVIQNDLWGQHSPLFLQGAPGSGKTTIALLSARVTLCPHRPPGTSDNCGKCDTCIGKDTTNIETYTCTGADADALQNLIDKSRSQPLPKAGSPRYRFFILDEVSNMSNQQLSKFLEVLETTNKYNIWVLVSMKPERMDSTLSNALLSRCSTFTFPPLNDSELTATLVSGGVDEDIAKVLAPFCRGNARLAWRQFDRLLLLNPDATPAWVESTLTGGATKAARGTMWQALHGKKVREVIDLLGGWGCDSLISLLREDVVEAMCARPLPIQGKVLHTLTTGREEDVLYILLSYVGEDVMGAGTPPLKIEPISNLRTSKAIVVPVTNDTPHVPLSEWSWLKAKYALVPGG